VVAKVARHQASRLIGAKGLGK